jgi:hypothetical protein
MCLLLYNSQIYPCTYEASPESKGTSRVGRDIFYAYYGNTAVDLDPLPVSRARLTVVTTGFV